jgi:hypothetical protein
MIGEQEEDGVTGFWCYPEGWPQRIVFAAIILFVRIPLPLPSPPRPATPCQSGIDRLFEANVRFGRLFWCVVGSDAAGFGTGSTNAIHSIHEPPARAGASCPSDAAGRASPMHTHPPHSK